MGTSRWLRLFFAVVFFAVFSLLFAGQARGQGPENVLVVVNENSELSQRIGTLYLQARKIPPANLCRIRVTPEERIARAVYENEIEKPVAACLRAPAIADKILFIATTLGVPLRILPTHDDSKLASDGASVDSELTLIYQKMRGAKVDLTGAITNPFFRHRDTPFTRKSFPIYLVTRLAAYSFEEVRRMIGDSLAARNQGRVVIDLKSSGDEEGNNWLRNAAILLPKERVIFDESNAVLRERKAVIGSASWGSNDKNRQDRFLKMQWLPGSLMLEYVSLNGRTFLKPPSNWTIGPWSDRSKYWQGAPQSLSADAILEGASAAGGHVDEPFLHFCARPDLVFPAYLNGRTLAEAYWLGVPALSWMNIVIGDPLMRLK